MASKTRNKAPARKKQPDAVLDLGSRILAEARRARVQAEMHARFASRMSERDKKKVYRAVDRARDKETQAQLIQVVNLGIYSPRLHRPELTPAQKRTVKKKFRLATLLAERGVFAPFPKGSTRKTKNTLIKLAQQRGGQGTSKGIFVLRSDKELKQGRGKIIRERDTGLYKIQVVKTFKSRKSGTVTRTEQRYLDGESAIIAVEKKLKARLAKMTVRPNERLRFAIGGTDGNISHRAFNSLEKMIEYASAYRGTTADRANFLASLTIYKVAKKGKYYDLPVSYLDAKGRERDADADMVQHFMDARGMRAIAQKKIVKPRKKTDPRRRNKG